MSEEGVYYGGPVGRGCRYVQVAVLRSYIVQICCHPQLQPLEFAATGTCSAPGFAPVFSYLQRH